MASEAVTNGSSATTESQSAAEKLLAKHAADEAHKVQIEDVVDEEDVAHPAPSAALKSSETTMSDIAKGKKKVDDAAPAPKPKGPVFDVASEEAFPALGGPAPRPAATSQMWGKKPPVMQTNGAKSATNGSTNAPTRGSTPSLSTPGSNPGLAMPGRHVERISLHPQQITPRNQLKKPVGEILRDINRRSKASIVTKEGANGHIVFEGQGPVDAVRQALKEIVQQIGTKQSIKVPIPASVRPHIIGRQGATIQSISKRTGAKVQIPKQEDSPTPIGDDDDDTMIDVVIEGDALAAEMARREIEAIVNERTSTVNMRLKDIPAEFYPFLAGPHNGRVSDLEGGRDIKIQIPHYHTWKDQAPPEPAGQGQPVPFLAQPSLPIQISGDRIAAQQARSEIEALVASMRRNLTLDQTPIDRGRHQFIIGDRGVSLHDFLAETGCALIKPPLGADDDNLYIVGPADKLQGGVDKVMELAAQMQSMNVDVAKPHINARGGGHPHARNMTRYFQQKQALAELEQLHDASIVLPTGSDGPTAWEVYAKNFKNATKARQDIMNLVGAHPPSRFQPMQIDPFFHQHLQQREAPKIRREHGVHVVFPDGHSETPDILLVFEAPGSPSEYVIPRQQPSAADVKQHLQAVQQAQSYLQNIIAQQQALESRDIEAHPRYNEKIRRYLEREQHGLPQGQFPIQATFPTGRSKVAPGFSIRGPSSAVDDMNAKLLAFLEQEAKDEAERGFTTSFDYPQKFANFLIGKRGENINRLREEFDVEIQVKDGKCELKGPEKKCAACRAHILSQLKKLEDETTHTIKVKPQYHRELIGPKGAQVNRLQDRYNVRVNFPRNAAPTEDDATEGSIKNFRNQAPDEVIIKGPKKGADEAREELLNLLQWTMDNSHSASVSVQQSQVPSLIGAGGREMESLRLATGAQVDIPNARDAADASGRVEIKLKGTKKQVEDAKKLLQERAKIFDETVTKNIDVDRKHHKTLIGTGGANVRKLVIDAGGPDDNRAIAQIVRFPKQGDADNNIRIQGPKAMVDKIVAAIQAQVEEKAGQVSDSIEVPTEKHRILIGRGGEARRQLESKFNISIDIPRQGTSGPAASQINLTGQPSDLEAAKEHIAGLIKEQEGETVDVPRRFHHDVSDNGQIFRSLLRNHKVTIDHAGQQPPPRPTARTPRGRANGGTAMPLITDDASSADTHSWELVDDSSVYEGADGDETIPWILRGSPEGVAKAKAQLEKALAEAGEPSWSGYLILSDPKTYRHIIGPGGSQINSIRKKTGTKVQVPKNQGEGEAVEIVGTKEGVEEAKQIILDIVKNAGNGGPRR